MTSTSRSSGVVPRDDQPGRLEPAAQEVVDLVAVAVALVDHGLAVDLPRLGALVQLHRVGAEPHGAAHVGDLLLLGQQVDDRERRSAGRTRVEFAPAMSDHVAGEVGDRHLHAEADAQVRDALLARDPGGGDLALDAALAEAARDQDAVGLLDPVRGPPRRPASRSRPSRSRRRTRGRSRSGAAPPRPTGRRPRAGCTCRRARSGPACDCFAAASAFSMKPFHAVEIRRLGLHARSARARSRRRPRPGSRAAPCRSGPRRAPRRPPRPAATRTARSSCGCRSDSPPSERQTTMSGWMPMRRSSLTECCVGLVFSSPAWPMYGTSVRWMNMHRSPARRRPGTAGSPPGTAATRCRPPCRRSP